MRRHLSLFSGIGGFDLAAHWAGFETTAFCEKEPYCRRVLARHWPGVPIFEDIHDITSDTLLPFGEIDLCSGGFPCQDISAAGDGAGIDGERSRLWFEMLRVVRAAPPRWVVVENVSALRIRGADQVLEGLEEAGYACWPVVVGSNDAGAPHLRKRVFIVAYRLRQPGEAGPEQAGWKTRADTCGGGERAELDNPGDRRCDHRTEREAFTESDRTHNGVSCPASHVALAGVPGLQIWPGAQTEWAHAATPGSAERHIEPGLGRVSYGLPDRLDFPGWTARRGEPQHEWEPPRVAKGTPDRAARLKAIGNAVNPRQIYPVLQWIADQIGLQKGMSDVQIAIS